MVNPLSGHTTGQTASSESLKDGAGLTSTSLTNLYEGLHGNGIVRLDDRAYGDTNRQNTGTNTAGHVAVSSGGSVTVYGGYAVLGGILYSFANGPNSSKTYTAGDTAWHLGSLPSVPASNSDVIVTVYVVADNNTGVANVKHHFGTPVVTSTGTPLTSDSFLSQPQGTGGSPKNEEATVLAVLRYTMTGGAANVTASLNTPTVSDKRCLLSNSPMYLTPLTSGATGSYASGDSIDHANRSLDTMDGVVSGTESGAFNASPLGAIWQSHSPDGHAVLYYSARRDQGGSPARNTWRLAPNEVKTITTGSNQTATFDGPNIWVITTTGNITLTPTNTFPHSHTIRVYHPSGSHTLHFDPSGLNYDVAAGKSVTFGYDGSAWSVIGLSGAGVGTVTSIATTAPITGGTITTTGTIGISAATTSAAGSMSAADKTKLDGITAGIGNGEYLVANANVADNDFLKVDGTSIEGRTASEVLSDLGVEPSADVTDATNVKSALDNMTLTDVGTPASTDRILLQDASASNELKYADFSEFGGGSYTDADAISAVEGEATLALTGDVTIAAGKDLTVDTDTLHVDSANNRVGIGTTSPGVNLDVKTAGTTIARVASTGSHANLRFGRANSSYDAAMLFYDDMASTPALQWRIQMTNGGTDLSIRDEDGSPDGQEIMKFKDGGGVDINSDVVIASGHDLTVDTNTLHVDAANNRVGIGTTSPSQALHVSGTIRQTSVTSNVLVANANGELVAASNLTDVTHLQPGQAEGDAFTATTSTPSWAGAPPTTIQEAIERIATYVTTEIAALGGATQIP